MDFEKICMMFTMQEAYYGILLSAMNRVPTDKISTMAVGRAGNVFKLYYNPNFTSKLDIDTTLQCLKHEVLHCAFNHFTLWDDNNTTPEIHDLQNIAADMEVNCYIDTSVIRGIKPVLASDMGWEKYLGAREYFNRLLQLQQQAQQQQQQQAQSPQQQCNGGQGGNSEDKDQGSSQQSQGEQEDEEDVDGTPSSSSDNTQPSQKNGNPVQQNPQSIADQFEPFDDHSQWPTGEDIEAEQLQQVIDDLLVFAAEECEKSRGSIPGEVKGRIDTIKNKKRPKPVADWKRYFRRYMGNEFSEFIRKSKKRESRRFPDAAGNRHRRKSHILVAIDTSGSVSMPEYMEFFGQIKTLTQSASFHVLECDATIQHEYDFKGKVPTTLHGGGGTDFQPVVDYFNKHRRDYDALVYFTDGYSDIPTDTPKETLWVISSNGYQDRSRYKINGASSAFIKSRQ